MFLCVFGQSVAGLKRDTLSPSQRQVLDSSMKVSAAAIETGRPVAAERLL